MWYIEEKTLIIILIVTKKLNRDIREKIVQIIDDEEYKKEFPMEYILFDIEEIVGNYMDTSDYYFSE